MSRLSVLTPLLLLSFACSDTGARLGDGSARGAGDIQPQDAATQPATDPSVDPGVDPDVDPDVDPVMPPVSPLEPTDGFVIQDCATDAGYEVDAFSRDNADDTRFWLLSVYETHTDHSFGNHPMGEATLDVTEPGGHVIAIGSYEPVTWNLTVGPDSEVEEILVFGYHEQIVEGAQGIPVTYVEGPACGYAYPDDGQGCDTQGLIDEVEAAAGRLVSHFEGCYRATDFDIGSGADPVVTDPNGVPVSDVPCAPGETVELAFPVSEAAMALGASDPGGAGWCSGTVTFFDDPTPQMAGYFDYEAESVQQIPFNGFAAQEGCGEAHCNDLMYGDGRVTEGYCSLYAVCENGLAHTTGFTW